MATNEAEEYFETGRARRDHRESRVHLAQPITLADYYKLHKEQTLLEKHAERAELAVPALDMNREQDDPKPGLQSVTDMVISDLQARRIASIPKYGSELKTYNGRNPMLDAYQELLDLVLYMRQLLAEGLYEYEVPELPELPDPPEVPELCLCGNPTCGVPQPEEEYVDGCPTCNDDLYGGICG